MPFSSIAIVGQGCALPGALTPAALWELVRDGRSAISRVSKDEWRLGAGADREKLAREVSSDAGGYVRGFDEVFDPSGFLVPAERLLGLDPVFSWTLHAAREALRSARMDLAPRARGVVVLGNLSYPTPGLVDLALETWKGAGAGAAKTDPRNRFMSGLPAMLTAEAVGFRNGAFGLDAACASSLYAIKLACDRLNDGEADVALAGGVNHADDLVIHLGFTALAALSPTGRSRPFHRDADGLVPAQGAAMVVLKRLADAEAAGDRILGVIRAVGLSNDGRSRGLLVPSEDGQIRAMRAAYAMSGIAPSTISLVECHATGTAVGDATELRSMRAVFEGATDVPIGSLKSNLGHLITASGTAALIKVLAAMDAGVRPPTLHADAPLDGLDAAGGALRLLRQKESWPDREVRRAAISNFGFGGNNAHLIVEQWSQPQPSRSNGAILSHAGTKEPVAVVALAVTAGAASSTAELEDALLAGRSLLEGDPPQAAAADFEIDVAGLRAPPADLKEALSQQTLLLRTALQLADVIATLPVERTALLVGMQCDAEVARSALPWRGDESREAGSRRPMSAALVVGCMPNIVANRLSHQFDLRAPSFTISAEEASGTVALDLAVRSLQNGEVDAALVGAVDLSCEPVQRAAGIALLPAQRHAPGDAAVMLVLKRVSDARKAGDRVLAVIDSHSHADAEVPATDAGGLVSLRLAGDDAGLSSLFGHAHAASGLLHVAAAVTSCEKRALPSRDGRPAMPWLPSAGTRRAQVVVEALGGSRTTTHVRTDERTPSPRRSNGPRVSTFAAATVDGLIRALSRRDSDAGEGDVRIAVFGSSEKELAARIERAAGLMESHGRSWNRDGDSARLDDGIYFGQGPMRGELGFVFTGPAGAYPHMGRDLGLALPELVDRLGARMSSLREAAGWIYDEGPTYRATPTEKLWGSSFLIQLHSELTRGLLKMKPHAGIGYCSGETNALFALGAWTDLDGFRRAIDERGVYTRELCGELRCVRRAWNVPANTEVRWSAQRVRAPLNELRAALSSEPHVYVTIINGPSDIIIAGDPAGCARVGERLGMQKLRPIDYDFVMHCPEAREYADEWRALHHRPTAPVPGVRFYTHATLSSYSPTDDAVADALTGQAMNPVDFPALIERAWADGVRVFVEHGPHAGCTRWIHDVLGDREHVAVALDTFGRSSLLQAVESVAHLFAVGVPMDRAALEDRLGDRAPASNATPPVPARRALPVTFRAHFEPVVLAKAEHAPPVERRDDASQVMAPAPRLPPVMRSARAVAAPAAPGTAALAIAEPSARVAQPTGIPVIDDLRARHAALAELHGAFLRQQADVQQRFVRMMFAPLGAIPHAPRAAASLPVRASEPAEVAQPAQPAQPAQVAQPAPVEKQAQTHAVPCGPRFSRAELEVLASGTISSVFGPLFEKQDRFARQVRMPEPPLLLADRVLGIDGAPGEMGLGTIWTETDIAPDAWYLHEGRMPAGILVESGQADLLLISWLGVDFHNRGERVYRLLGCDLTSHGELPRPGDTLRYEIHVDGHARQGDVRLFFFHYDCWVDGVLRVTVRNGQAGFFTTEELAESAGILWSAADAKPTEAARLDPPAKICEKNLFSADDITAFIAGDARTCFGPGFERAETHTLTPSIQGGRMRLLDEVTHFDRDGGPWGRGYLRARLALHEDHWFFRGHFKNDPCMPGTLMFEGCLQAMSIYLAALGYTLDRDGWRFEPIPEHAYHLRCRGQALPTSKEVIYEVFIDEIVGGPTPTLYADLLGSVDGLKAFHCRRMGLRLVPAWPLDKGRLAVPIPPDERPVARSGDFEFDYRSLLACAWARPSEAFGEMYAPFDGTRRVARLPGPPYHFMSRVSRVEGPIGGMVVGSIAEVEYDVPADAWYFEDNGARVMPYAVLLEVALQPCGWLASYIGSARTTEVDLVFRNLDGKGTVHREVPPDVGRLTTVTKLTSSSTAGGLIILGFDVTVRAGEAIVYKFETVFGFFTTDTMRHQVGLATTAEERLSLTEACEIEINLASRPARLFEGTLRLAEKRMLMIDRVTGLWPTGGKKSLGRVRAEKDVKAGEWFFKAHFFQDPVQPGSLGLEALLQALQVLMIERGMGSGLEAPRFEAIALDVPMAWKYRGQVVPENEHVVADLEVTETGEDARGRFALADGSLWVDGKRIYHATGLGMRIVSGAPAERAPRPIPHEPTTRSRDFDRTRAKTFWRDVVGAEGGWAGEDILFGLLDRFVGRVHAEDPGVLAARRGSGALYVANHQVAVETVLAAIVIGATTGRVTTLPAKSEHRHTWIGELMELLTTRPGVRDPRLLRFIDRDDPTSVLRVREELMVDLKRGRSALVHVEGTRATSCRHPVETMSAVFLDLAIEANVDVVPVRFVGGLPIEPSSRRLEFPLGYGKQEYWFGRPISGAELKELPFGARKHRVLSAINALGVAPDAEQPTAPSVSFAGRVRACMSSLGLSEAKAVMLSALEELQDASDEGQSLLPGATHRAQPDDPLGSWLQTSREWLLRRA